MILPYQDAAERGGATRALAKIQPQSIGEVKPEYAMSEWCINVPLRGDGVVSDPGCVQLFGVAEDVSCTCIAMQQTHEEQKTREPYCRTLCPGCRVPVCRECMIGLATYKASMRTSTVPMALANDNYYGYAHRLLVEKQITWLERAASSLVWTTFF